MAKMSKKKISEQEHLKASAKLILRDVKFAEDIKVDVDVDFDYRDYNFMTPHPLYLGKKVNITLSYYVGAK